ncbi:MAG: uracil-xanthine permease, partial [Clostridia bacterium]|nr:uracil-xanthine permease [Clostridia bacterium]
IGLAVGINYSASGALNITIGSVTIGFTGLAVGALVGILLNAVLPDKEWQFREKIKNVHKMNIKENKDERNSN